MLLPNINTYELKFEFELKSELSMAEQLYIIFYSLIFKQMHQRRDGEYSAR